MHYLISFIFILSLQCFSNVKSTTGNIYFDSENDQQAEMTLNSIGLGIGTSPSTNLHVNGNAIVSNNLYIGSYEGSANLNLNGTFGASYEVISSNTTLDNTSYILANTSSQNIVITLPYAGNCNGRHYYIKRINSQNHLIIRAASGNFENGYSEVSFLYSDETLPFAGFMSASDQWYLTYHSEQVVMGNVLDGLVGWYKFDENSGTTANDSSGLDHHGTAGSLDFSGNGTSGVLNRALVFDGNDDYIVADSLATDMQGESSWSVTCWAKGSYSSNPCAIGFTNAGGGSSNTFILYPYDTNGGNGTRIWYNGQTILNDNAGGYDDGDFHFFTFISYNETSHEYFIDGVSQGTSGASKSLPVDLSQFNIGRWKPNNQHFKGTIDDVRVYNRPLTSSELQILYNEGI